MPDDDRITCQTCRHYSPGRCGNFRRAGFSQPALAEALAVLPQRCPGYAMAGQDGNVDTVNGSRARPKGNA